MNKYQNDSEALRLQNLAYEAAAREALACESFLSGRIAERDYLNSMAETERAVNDAVKFGVSLKDLPAC